MQEFLIKELVTENIEQELDNIGFDISYRAKASDKFKYKNFKIFDLTLPQANILKQTALSFGADCGVHKEVLTNKIEKTDVILGGSYAQLKKICEKLKQQPFSLKKLAEKIETSLIKIERKTKLVGILNLTPDSFSNDGILEKEKIINKYYELIADGADIIDIGAESTRPNSIDITPEEQINRLKLFFNNIKNFEIPISIDTRSSIVAKYALDNGASIINDVSGFDFDRNMIDTISKYNATIIIQHSTGKANNIVKYKNVIEEVYFDLKNKINFAKSNGIQNIIIDVGIGFGKNKYDNLNLLNRIDEFKSLNTQLMVGVSRKSFLGTTNDIDIQTKDALTLALNYPLIQKNIDYIRVHNVKMHKHLLNLVNEYIPN